MKRHDLKCPSCEHIRYLETDIHNKIISISPGVYIVGIPGDNDPSKGRSVPFCRNCSACMGECVS